VSFDAFMTFARRTAPELTAWITPDSEPGLHACFTALGELDGAREAMLGAGVPIMIWEGNADPFHDRKKTFAADSGLAFLSTPGDHLGMLFRHGAESGRGLRAFLDRI